MSVPALENGGEFLRHRNPNAGTYDDINLAAHAKIFETIVHILLL